MKPKTTADVNTTQKCSELIAKFLCLMAEIHKRKVSPAMIDTYEAIFSDVPYEDLRGALKETIRTVEFWPTPGHIQRKLDDLANKKAQAPAQETWTPPEDWVVEDDTKEERAAFVESLRETEDKSTL